MLEARKYTIQMRSRMALVIALTRLEEAMVLVNSSRSSSEIL